DHRNLIQTDPHILHKIGMGKHDALWSSGSSRSINKRGEVGGQNGITCRPDCFFIICDACFALCDQVLEADHSGMKALPCEVLIVIIKCRNDPLEIRTVICDLNDLPEQERVTYQQSPGFRVIKDIFDLMLGKGRVDRNVDPSNLLKS